MEFIESLYSELLDEKRITKLELKTNCFYSFNYNIGGALVLPTLKYGPLSDNDFALIHTLVLHGLALTQIITSLETYYSDIFSILTNNINVSQIDPDNLKTFIHKNRLSNELVENYGKHKDLNFPLALIIPQYFPLQEKNRIKTAFQCLNINPNVNESEWQRTFGNDNNSTVKQRHMYVHSGVNLANIQQIIDRLSETKRRIKDAIVLVYSIENQLQSIDEITEIKDLYSQ